MPEVVFKFDRERDLYNIWETCNKDSGWYDYKKTIHPQFLSICEGKSFEGCKEELEKSRRKMHDSGLIEVFALALQEAWKKINEEYFKRLENITKKPIYTEEFSAYVTTVVRCPYSYEESWFMVSFFRDMLNALKTAGHEIIHLQFHHYYWESIEKEIGNEKTADLKEALTVLLNLEFKDLWFVEDSGYEKHKELRKFIEEEWKKEKEFDVLLKKCIDYLKDDS